MQVAAHWTEPGGTLGELTARARVRARALAPRRAALEQAAAAAPLPAPFAVALRRPDVAVIAEVKRRSPSRGDINVGIRTGDQAAAYASGGAAALSILTEPDRFGGAAEDLADARRRVTLPLLRKDFIVDPLQLAEARALGASAALLIARALDRALLMELAAAARAFGLEPVIEVRDEAELMRALDAGARVVGVNNRDLETLRVDPDTGVRLIPCIPADVIAIAESGIAVRADVERAAAAGADAILVGSSVSVARDPAAAVRALVGVARGPERPRAHASA